MSIRSRTDSLAGQQLHRVPAISTYQTIRTRRNRRNSRACPANLQPSKHRSGSMLARRPGEAANHACVSNASAAPGRQIRASGNSSIPRSRSQHRVASRPDFRYHPPRLLQSRRSYSIPALRSFLQRPQLQHVQPTLVHTAGTGILHLEPLAAPSEVQAQDLAADRQLSAFPSCGQCHVLPALQAESLQARVQALACHVEPPAFAHSHSRVSLGLLWPVPPRVLHRSDDI